MFNRLCAFVVFGVLVFASSGALAAAGEVALRGQTDVDRAAIRLSDVFENLPEGRDRDIATAPLAGKSVTYDVNVLSSLAQQYRLDWQPLSVDDRCILTRLSSRVTQDMIREAVMLKLRTESLELKDLDLEVTFDGRSPELVLAGGQTPSFSLKNFSYDMRDRRFRAEVLALSEGRAVAVPVAGRVGIRRAVPVLAHRMEGGSIIGETDLSWVTVTAERLPPDMLAAPESLIGRELRRDMLEGVPLRIRDVALPRLVTHGSLVSMRIETLGLLITTQGRVMQDGCMGDVVRVTNTQSKRVIEGTVVGPNTVRIPLPQDSVSVHAAAASPVQYR